MIKYHPKKTSIFIAMAKKGFNQKGLCIEAGVNPSTLSNFLNYKKSISPRSATKIAIALDTEIEELFDIEINPAIDHSS
ncbi:helix-turn-helix transcriptional regulator [Lysinibacillus agricola]|uniref:helix-turn-helix transcriptional regulator n=1 Tax=Lysinibacillus TaxID=400634 RepID=UPI003C188F07